MGESHLPKTFREFFEWLAIKLLWFLIIPIFTFLGYITQIRPYLLTHYGIYVTAFTDGALVTVSLLIFAFWLMSKIMPDSS